MPFPPAPFRAPTEGTLEERLAVIASAISQKADRTVTPVYSSVVLLAPNGGAWLLSVQDDGTLQMTQVER